MPSAATWRAATSRGRSFFSDGTTMSSAATTRVPLRIGTATEQPPALISSTVVTGFARGLLDRLLTRAYLPLPDGASDPVLDSVDPDRRGTLVCAADEHGYRFDVRLQGEGETVFLTHRGH